jgi:hypothetical protein
MLAESTRIDCSFIVPQRKVRIYHQGEQRERSFSRSYGEEIAIAEGDRMTGSIDGDVAT